MHHQILLKTIKLILQQNILLLQESFAYFTFLERVQLGRFIVDSLDVLHLLSAEPWDLFSVFIWTLELGCLSSVCNKTLAFIHFTVNHSLLEV